ncbi:hypothetical protein [Massilia aquatica]|uniref:DUF1640 domain-containing protein n=1 Tax=Massilia aquatica TaxID=2609000 RepID=A0ABX0M1K9_9BURK|nr:hypothetical protein [Massilia aquatica]NHZ41051.1 hypothetical protein [Massilia aquatica]
MSMNAVPNGPPEPGKQGAPLAGGAGPPHDFALDRRLTVLETRFDTIVPILATKADLGALRLEVEKIRSELLGKIDAEGSGLRGKIDALGSGLRGKIDALGCELRGEMSELASDLREEMVMLRNEVHATLMKAMMWFGALAITVIFSFVGVFIHFSNQVSNQISHLSARLPVITAPLTPTPHRPVPDGSPPTQR